MIVAKQALKEYIKNQKDFDSFCIELGVSNQTVYNVMNEQNVSSAMIFKLLEKSGFEFDKAFETKPELYV